MEKTMKCLDCGSEMKRFTQAQYRYTLSGLTKVYLNGVIEHRCSSVDCGGTEIDIPNIEELHNLLSSMIAKQECKLAPEEIRFLRTHLGFSGVDFARKVGVDAATVSRWENGKMPMGEANEKLLRIMILAQFGPISDYELMDRMAQKESALKRKTLELNHSKWREKAA
jgi:putative transcriptional regulator